MMIAEHPQTGWSVYVLRNPDGKLYIGQTRNLSHRLRQHNDPAHTLTRTTECFRGPWKLIHSEALTSRSAALAREKALKSGQKSLAESAFRLLRAANALLLAQQTYGLA